MVFHCFSEFSLLIALKKIPLIQATGSCLFWSLPTFSAVSLSRQGHSPTSHMDCALLGHSVFAPASPPVQDIFFLLFKEIFLDIHDIITYLYMLEFTFVILPSFQSWLCEGGDWVQCIFGNFHLRGTPCASVASSIKQGK